MSNDDSFRGGPRRPGGGFRSSGPRPSRPAGPASEGDRPRKPFFRDGDAPRGPRRDFGDAPRRDFNAGPGGPRREGGDAPRRSFDGPRDFRRDGDAPRGPRRDFNAGPGGPRREGGDAPRRSFDGPRDFRRDGDAPRGPRRDFGDATRRDFNAGPGGPRREGGDAPRRSFDGPRDFRRDGDVPRGPRRDFGDGPKREFSPGPRRDGDAPRGPRRDFNAGPRREGGDAPRRSFDGPRDFRREGGDAPRRDFRRDDTPPRAFFREESAPVAAAPGSETASEVSFESPLHPATAAPISHDDWEIPLAEDDGDAGAPARADADAMIEVEDRTPVPVPVAVDDPEDAAAPLATPDARITEYSRREPRETRWQEDRRAPERQESRGFDNDARRAQRQREVRIHGLNACVAVVRDRRDAIRKAYLRHDRAEDFAALLEWCRAQHLAYRYVTDSELSALTGSEHHEGICLEIERKPFLAFETLLNQLKLDHGPKVLLLLDGVGNPHNIGGVLRAAAHFGVHALLLPPDSALQLSAASYRTAEGGAELVPIVKLRELGRDLEALGALDFHVIGSFPRDATSIHTTRWPERTLLVIGAEQSGIRPATEALCDRRFTIPGSGAVESLNVATAAAVLLSAYAGSLARETWAASKS
jgi:TrmH RNA methyltransferase